MFASITNFNPFGSSRHDTASQGQPATPARRTELELGLTTWAFRNMATCLERGLLGLDLTDTAGAVEFVARTQCNDREVMEGLGRDVRQVGCAEKYAEFWQLLAEGYAHWVYRKVTADWKEPESTVCYREEYESSRYDRSPRGENLTSALDCAMVLANMMKVGRIRADALPLHRLASLPETAFGLRYAMSRPLGNFTQNQWDDLRGVLLSTLFKLNPTVYGDPDTCSPPFNNMFQELTRGLPQVSWYQVTTTVCCDGRVRTRTKVPRNLNCMYIDIRPVGSMVQTIIGGRMNNKEDVVEEGSCSKGEDCSHKAVRRRNTVLGRLPPRLVVSLTPVMPMKESVKAGVFKEVRFKYRTWEGTLSITYEPVGVVYVSGHDHHTCRWKRDERDYIHFDNGVFVPQRSLSDGCERYHVGTIIYEMKMSAPFF